MPPPPPPPLLASPLSASPAPHQDKEDEWNIIDDAILAKALGCVSGTRPTTTQTLLLLDDAISDATTLTLSHFNLYKIDNLQCFRCLTTLRLDNNGLTHVENLEGLASLTWLDLSFNRLVSVEGLARGGGLPKLTDLTLYHNQLESLEDVAVGLKGCPALQYLSVGKNPCVEMRGRGQQPQHQQKEEEEEDAVVENFLISLQKQCPRLRCLVLLLKFSTAAGGAEEETGSMVMKEHLPMLAWLDYVRV